MKKLEEKFIFLLAESSLKESEMDKLIGELKNGGLERCFNKALKIRKILKESDDLIDRDLPEPPISNYHLKIVEQADMLLRGQAHMTVKEAMNALSEELKIKIPSSNRSFRDQIVYLCNQLEGAQIISAAHKIRNRFARNYKKSDWPLRDNKWIP
jgi:hypothetical protein